MSVVCEDKGVGERPKFKNCISHVHSNYCETIIGNETI